MLLITPLVRDYLLNYARSLIYTTSLSHANIIAADCSFDLLESGEADKVHAHPLCVVSITPHTNLPSPPHASSPRASLP